MVDVIIDGEPAYCLPDCTCCTACHKLIDEVDECPFPEPYGLWSDKYKCTPDCEYYQEIWDEKELKERYRDMDVTHTVHIAKMNALIEELEESQRWRKFSKEKPTEEMEGEDFIVSNGYYSVVCEWRGYWNNEPFYGDKNCDDVKYWKPLTQAPKEGE